MFLLLHMFKKGLSKNMVLKCEIPEKGYRKTCCETGGGESLVLGIGRDP
jgi:hypothetical protein